MRGSPWSGRRPISRSIENLSGCRGETRSEWEITPNLIRGRNSLFSKLDDIFRVRRSRKKFGSWKKLGKEFSSLFTRQKENQGDNYPIPTSSKHSSISMSLAGLLTKVNWFTRSSRSLMLMEMSENSGRVK